MEINNVNIQHVKTPANFAELKGVSRQFVYQLIDKQEIDYTIIDGVIFIVMNDKAKKYIKKR